MIEIHEKMMKTRNNLRPFNWLSNTEQKIIFIVFLCLTIFIIFFMNVLNESLITEVAPLGIISFELAGDFLVAQTIVQSWGQIGKISAGISLGLDYLFIVTYSISIALGCLLVARGISQQIALQTFGGIVIPWALFIAALLDSFENYALINILLGSKQEYWPIIAFWCAIVKFLILAIGIAYICIGIIVYLNNKFIKYQNSKS